MPYLLLVIGALIGLYALYRFFLNANIHQIKALFLTSLLTVIALALFYMAITGRLAAALGLLVVASPVLLSLFRIWHTDEPGKTEQTSSEIKTRAEALEVLGLQDSASEAKIKAAYKKLMQKVHPDHEGSQWMAARLNQARDILLK